MKYRAQMIGAEIHFRVHPNGGTVVTCSFAKKDLGEEYK